MPTRRTPKTTLDATDFDKVTTTLGPAVAKNRGPATVQPKTTYAAPFERMVSKTPNASSCPPS